MDRNKADMQTLRQGYKLHACKINKLQEDLERVQRQHEQLKENLTPRDPPKRYPDMYYGRGAGDETRRDPKSPDDERGDERRPFMYGVGDRGDDTRRDAKSPEEDTNEFRRGHDHDRSRNEGFERRPEMYYGRDGRDGRGGNYADPGGRPSERRPEMYRGERMDSGRHSDRDYHKYDFEKLREEDRKLRYGYHDSTDIYPDKDKPFKGTSNDRYQGTGGDRYQGTGGDRYQGTDSDRSGKNSQDPGGFGIMRYHCSDYETVRIGIKMIESILKNAGGYIMGTATSKNVHVYETSASRELCWVPSRKQDSNDYMCVDQDIVMFWLKSQEAAEIFFRNTHHSNRFKENIYPSAHGHEALFVSCNTVPTAKVMNTFLLIEFLDAHKNKDGNFTEFQRELKDELQSMVPDCAPTVTSSFNSVRYYKPGNMISPFSWTIICRFTLPSHVDRIWKSGVIQNLQRKWNLPNQLHVCSYTITPFH